jgi:hypothetical protein
MPTYLIADGWSDVTCSIFPTVALEEARARVGPTPSRALDPSKTLGVAIHRAGYEDSWHYRATFTFVSESERQQYR